MKIIGCIPARYASTRLPGKPLCEIAGKPLILHVIERAKQSKKLSDIVVLTDDQRIFNVVQKAGHAVVMTSTQCQNGTERLVEFLDKADADILINIQGDEILLNPKHIDALVEDFLLDDANEMGTLAHWENDINILQDPTTAKIVTDLNYNALYFSRTCIPVLQSGELPKEALVQIGIYIYRRETLEKLENLDSSPLELTEKLEQLRALENNIQVHITIVEAAETLSVDTPADLEKARQLFK